MMLDMIIHPIGREGDTGEQVRLCGTRMGEGIVIMGCQRMFGNIAYADNRKE